MGSRSWIRLNYENFKSKKDRICLNKQTNIYLAVTVESFQLLFLQTVLGYVLILTLTQNGRFYNWVVGSERKPDLSTV